MRWCENTGAAASPSSSLFYTFWCLTSLPFICISIRIYSCWYFSGRLILLDQNWKALMGHLDLDLMFGLSRSFSVSYCIILSKYSSQKAEMHLVWFG